MNATSGPGTPPGSSFEGPRELTVDGVENLLERFLAVPTGLEGDLAIPADDEQVRNGFDAVSVTDPAGRVVGHRQLDVLEPAQQATVHVAIVLEVDRDDFEAILACGILQAREYRQFLATVPAPGCPERHDQNLSAPSADEDLVAVAAAPQVIGRCVSD